MAIRFTSYFGAMWWNCIAAYSSVDSGYKDTLTKQAFVVPVLDTTIHTKSNRVACMAQTIATYTGLSIPDATAPFMEVTIPLAST
jgi:hypothetical protein